MLQDYNINPQPELAKKILQKVRNNRVTNLNFCSDIEDELAILEYVQNETEQKKQLEDNYTNISAVERQTEFLKIRDILMRIKKYTERGD